MKPLSFPRIVVDFGDPDMNEFFEYLKTRLGAKLMALSESRQPLGLINLQDIKDCARLVAQEVIQESQNSQPYFEDMIYDMLKALFEPLEKAMQRQGLPTIPTIN